MFINKLFGDNKIDCYIKDELILDKKIKSYSNCRNIFTLIFFLSFLSNIFIEHNISKITLILAFIIIYLDNRVKMLLILKKCFKRK